MNCEKSLNYVEEDEVQPSYLELWIGDKKFKTDSKREVV